MEPQFFQFSSIGKKNRQFKIFFQLSQKNLFITGIGTDVGKTIVSAIVAEALGADYWKPVQAGYETGTDSEWVRSVISRQLAVHAELYKLKLPASPHIAAREENIKIDCEKIKAQYLNISSSERNLVIEGAGGLMVPINDDEKVIDLIRALNVGVIIVSRNYLGSINHSLLTASVLQSHNLPVVGFVFNDDFMSYEQEIVKWSGYPLLGSIPHTAEVNRKFILEQAEKIRPQLLNWV
jgi:dethiobiotin synthetase